MWFWTGCKWAISKFQQFGGWAVSSVDPTVQTSEIRLIAYGAFVFVGLGLILVEFHYTHRINNIALGTMASACALGTFSIPKKPDQ